MTTRDIAAYLGDPVLTYPGIKSEKYPDGKTYTVPWPSRRRGLRMTALANLGWRAAANEKLTDAELAELEISGDDMESDFERMTLGPALDEMTADDVSDFVVQKIARDAFYCFTSSDQLADLVLQGEAAARDEARADQKPKRGRSAKAKAGSNSGRASGATPARTRNRASTRSSTSAKPRARKSA